MLSTSRAWSGATRGPSARARASMPSAVRNVPWRTGPCTAQPVADAAAASVPGEFVFVQGSNPPSLDAMSTSSQASRNINMNIYETLYGFDEHQQPIPILAEGVHVSDDGLTYRFTLRKGVKFHNMQEMTAKDVKASLERYRKVGATSNLLEPVKSIDITGDHEVTLTMDTEFAMPRPRKPIPGTTPAPAAN